MPLWHEKNADGSWSTHDESPESRSAQANVWILFVSLFGPAGLLHWLLCPYEAFKPHGEFLFFGLCPVFLVGVLVAPTFVIVWFFRKWKSGKAEAAATAAAEAVAKKERAERKKRSAEEKKARLEREIQEAEERRMTEELEERASAFEKEGRLEDAAKVREELKARALEKFNREKEAREAARKQKEADEIAKKKQELERLKNGTDEDDGSDDFPRAI